MTQRCRGVTSARRQRAETISTGKRDRKSINCFDQRQGGSIHCLIDSLMGCQSSDIQQSSSKLTVSQRQKSSCAWYSQKGPWWKTHHVRSSNSNHTDTATRATEEQNGWCKPHAIRSKRTRSKIEKNLKPSTRKHSHQIKRQCTSIVIRPDIQHSVNTLFRSMRNPTMIAMRGSRSLPVTCLARVKCIRSFVLIHMQKLCKCPSTATGLTRKKLSKLHWSGSTLSRMRSAHMGTHTEDESSFERRGPVVRHWFRSYRRSVGAVPLLLTDSLSARAACKRRGRGRIST